MEMAAHFCLYTRLEDAHEGRLIHSTQLHKPPVPQRRLEIDCQVGGAVPTRRPQTWPEDHHLGRLQWRAQPDPNEQRLQVLHLTNP